MSLQGEGSKRRNLRLGLRGLRDSNIIPHPHPSSSVQFCEIYWTLFRLRELERGTKPATQDVDKDM